MTDDDMESEEEEEEDSDGEDGEVLPPVKNSKSFVSQLLEDLQNNPYDSELHAALVSAQRENAALEKLRRARDEAASLVALPETFWLEWLEDEARLASPEDFDTLDAVYRRACAACPSAPVWLARCSFYRERVASEANGELAQRTRVVYEDALKVLGVHPGHGPEIWAEYRDFEESQLSQLTGPERAQQVLKVRSLFKRQMVLPLPGNQRLQEAYQTFEGSLEQELQNPSAAAKMKAYAAQAAEGWQKRRELEEKLQAAMRPAMVMVSVADASTGAHSPAEIATELLSLEETIGDKAGIFTAHLRCTHFSPKDQSVWERFSHFATTEMGNPSIAAEILDRAVHHLPGCSELWFRLHEAMEVAGHAVGALKAVTLRAQRAMKAHPEPSGAQQHELLLQHADACRRYADGSRGHTPADAEEAWCEMRSTLKEASKADDLGIQALLHWMKLEAYGAQNLDQVLLVGRRLMESWGAFYNAWSAFIAAARHATKIGGTGVVEALYKDAIAQVSDYPEQVRSDYLQFQRESGTLQGWLSAKAAMAVAPAPAEAAAPEAALVEAPKLKEQKPKVKEPKSAPKPKAVKRQAFRSQAQEKRQKTEGSQAFEAKTEPQKETKEQEPTIEAKAEKVEEPKEATEDTEPVEKPREDIEEAKDADLKDTAGDAMEDVSEKMLEEKQNEEKSQPHKGSHYHQLRLAEKAAELKPEDEGEHTIYVANLDWSVDEAQLYRIFQDVEGLKEVRLVRDFLKRSKGYAYVDFDSPEHVAEAVEKFSGHLVNNRAMKVAKSLPTKQLYEEKVLFVRNIGESAKEDDVKEAFKSHEVVSVRMPCGQEGHKGYAYVEFTNDEAVKVCLTLEGLEIGGQQVTLSRSIPMKDHRHKTAATRKDLPQRVNQRLIVQGKLDREDPVRQSAKCPTTVYVKNLAFNVDETALEQHFQSCGEVAQVLIVKTNDGRSRGFGFVEFQNFEGAQSALLLSDSILGGREIVVSKSSRAITQKKVKDDEEEGGKGPSKGKFKSKGEKGDKGKGKGKEKGKEKGKDKSKAEGGRRRFQMDDASDDGSADAKKPRLETAKEDEKDEKAENRPMSNADFRKFLLP